MSCFCYLHIFPNEKIYVGTTQKEKPEYRWGPTGSGYKRQPLIWRAIQKYGWENVKHKVIVCETPEEMWEKEKELIKKYDTANPEHGYNCSTGGEKSAFGFHPSEKTRKKLSDALKGRKKPPISEETRKKLSESHKDKHPTEETIRKMSESHKGKNTGPLSEKHRKKLSESHKGKISPIKGIPKTKVKWLTPQGEIIEMHPSHVSRYHKDWILIQNQE